MTTQEQIQKAIQDFIKAGDNNDGPLLEEVLHPQFQNVQDGFFQDLFLSVEPYTLKNLAALLPDHYPALFAI
jgi:hypothetical protein